MNLSSFVTSSSTHQQCIYIPLTFPTRCFQSHPACFFPNSQIWPHYWLSRYFCLIGFVTKPYHIFHLHLGCTRMLERTAQRSSPKVIPISPINFTSPRLHSIMLLSTHSWIPNS